MLGSIGIETSWDDYEDTLLASHCLSSSDNHGLKELALKYLDYSDTDEVLLKKQVLLACNRARDLGWNLGYDEKGSRKAAWDYWVPGQVFKGDTSLQLYGDKDVERTILLWGTYRDLLLLHGLVSVYEKEKNLQCVVQRVEQCGLSINLAKLEETSEYLSERSEAHKYSAVNRIKQKYGDELNIDSPPQLKQIVYGKDRFNLPVVRVTDKGQPSLDKEALTGLYENTPQDTDESYFFKDILASRSYGSGVKYMKGYKALAEPVYGDYYKLYPSLNQSGTQTTRFSSSNPNGQNVGKKNKVKLFEEEFAIPKLRDIFCPLPGKVWWSIDYSQIEIRIFATLSGELSIVEALDDGYDFHGFVASRIFNKPLDAITEMERTIAKNTNFAIIYGAGRDKVNRTAGIPNAYELFAGQFPNVTDFMAKTIAEVRKCGYVWTPDGYRIDVPMDKPYKGVNYLSQGTAGRIIKNAMVELGMEVDWTDVKMIMQIHDELIFEVNRYCEKNDTSYIRKIMNIMEDSGTQMGIRTPVSCEIISTDWGHGEEIEL